MDLVTKAAEERPRNGKASRDDHRATCFAVNLEFCTLCMMHMDAYIAEANSARVKCKPRLGS